MPVCNAVAPELVPELVIVDVELPSVADVLGVEGVGVAV